MYINIFIGNPFSYTSKLTFFHMTNYIRIIIPIPNKYFKYLIYTVWSIRPITLL